MSKKLIKSLLLISIGCAICGFGIINFAVTNQLADGGFTGITLILFHAFDISPALSNLILNIPMLLVGYHQFQRKTFYLTIFGTVMLSVFLRIFEMIGPIIPSLEGDMILAAVSYGVVVGGGMALIFHEDATTGGSDIMTKLLKIRLDIPMAKTSFIFDTVVIALSFFTFLSFPNAIYTLIGIFIYSYVIGKTQAGVQSGYHVIIISKHYDKMATLTQEKLGRKVTLMNGAGGFSKEEKKVMLTIIRKKQLVHLKRIIHQIDPYCFVSVTPVHETLGKGFTFEGD